MKTFLRKYLTLKETEHKYKHDFPSPISIKRVKSLLIHSALKKMVVCCSKDLTLSILIEIKMSYFIVKILFCCI
jgi:hypothetical protein